MEVHAYALMPNHFHLLVRSARGNLSRAMQFVGGKYTVAINQALRRDGPIFRGRFRSQLVSDSRHTLTVAAYIHLNPIRARLARRLDQNAWTSHRAYLGLDVPPDWLSTKVLIAEVGGRQAFADYVHALRVGRRPWPSDFEPEDGFFASAATATQTHSNIKERPARPGAPPAAVLNDVRQLTGATKRQLMEIAFGPRANPPRRFAVWALDRETDLHHSEIAELMGMSTNQVAQLLRRLRRGLQSPLGGWEKKWMKSHY